MDDEQFKYLIDSIYELRDVMIEISNKLTVEFDRMKQYIMLSKECKES